MKLSGKQLTTAVLIGLMGISAGGVVMAKPPVVQSQPPTTGGQQDPNSNPQGTQPPAGGQGQQDPKKTQDQLIAEIQTNLTKQGEELGKKATKDDLKEYTKTTDLENTYAKKTDLDGKATKDDLKEYTKTADLENTYAKKSDLDGKATKDDLKEYTKTADLDGKYILKTDLQTEVTNLKADSQLVKEAVVETKRQGNLAETAATKAEDAAKKANEAAAAYNAIAQSDAFKDAGKNAKALEDVGKAIQKGEDNGKAIADIQNTLGDGTKGLTKAVNDNKSELANKADKSELANKADKSELANKADKSELANKADKSELDKKADTDKVTAALGLKADKSELADYVRKSDLKIGNNAKDIQKVGARAAALAGLHPLEFDPSTKLSFAVSSGSYDGENSVAFGAFYRPTKNVMLSAASTMGSKNAYTFGMSFKFGKSSATTTTNTPDVQELYRVVGQLQYQVAAQQQEIQQLRQAAKKTK